jgi:hypothetical protein
MSIVEVWRESTKPSLFAFSSMASTTDPSPAAAAATPAELIVSAELAELSAPAAAELAAPAAAAPAAPAAAAPAAAAPAELGEIPMPQRRRRRRLPPRRTHIISDESRATHDSATIAFAFEYAERASNLFYDRDRLQRIHKELEAVSAGEDPNSDCAAALLRGLSLGLHNGGDRFLAKVALPVTATDPFIERFVEFLGDIGLRWWFDRDLRFPDALRMECRRVCGQLRHMTPESFHATVLIVAGENWEGLVRSLIRKYMVSLP